MGAEQGSGHGDRAGEFHESKHQDGALSHIGPSDTPIGLAGTPKWTVGSRAVRFRQVRHVVFPSVQLAIFFPLVLAVSWALMPRQHWWKPFILAVSYAFYAAADVRFCLLLAGVTLLNQAGATLVLRTADERRKTWIMAATVSVNLACLGIFKYYGFFTEEVAAVVGFLAGLLGIGGGMSLVPILSARFAARSFAPELDAYLEFKEKMGFYGNSRIWYLRQFDAYSTEHERTSFDRETVEGWVTEQLARSGRYRSWMSYIRDTGRWLQVHGHRDAYVLSDRWKAQFVPAHPYLLSTQEIERFFVAAACVQAQSPWRWQAAAFFTLMHSCGLRTGETRLLPADRVDREIEDALLSHL